MTDSEIQKEYECIIATGGNTNRLRMLRLEWDDNRMRRRQGTLTDQTRVNAVRKIIQDLCKLHGVPIKLTHYEWPSMGDEVYGRYWTVRAMYAGDTGLIYKPRFDKLMMLANEEIILLPFVVELHREKGPDFKDDEVDSEEIPDDYYDRDFTLPGAPLIDLEDLEDEEDIDNGAIYIPDPYIRRLAEWRIDTFIWQWPEAVSVKRRR